MRTGKKTAVGSIFILLVLMVTFKLAAQEHLDSNHQSLSRGYNSMEKEASLRVLLFSGTGWYRHADIPLVNGWIARLGAKHNMQIDVSETGADVSKDKLSYYDVIIFNNANVLDKVFDEEQRTAIEEWYKAGGGIVGLHALLVHQENWPWIMELGGCDFNSDSEFLKAKVLVDPKAMDHPTVKGMGKEFWYEADWTNHTKVVTGLPGLKVLLRVDESTYDPVREYFKTRGGVAMGEDHPIAWTRDWGGGKFFYTELGHDIRSLDTDFGRQHLIEGIKWVVKKD